MEDPNVRGQYRLEEAIRRYEAAYYDSLAEASGEIAYSKRHQEKMARLLRKERRSASPFGKRAAALLLAAALLCAGVLGVSASRHASVADWFEKIYERFTEIFFAKKDISIAPTRVETIYLPAYIPEGYSLNETYLAESESKNIWENDKDEQIVFMQATLDSKTTVDHEDATYETREIDGVKFFILCKKEKRCYYWNSGEYAYSLIVAETLSEEDALAIIRSIEKTDRER